MGVAVIFFKILNSPPKRSRAQPVARRKIENTTGQQCPKLLHLGEWKMGVYGSYKDSFGFLKLFHSISFKTWPCESSSMKTETATGHAAVGSWGFQSTSLFAHRWTSREGRNWQVGRLSTETEMRMLGRSDGWIQLDIFLSSQIGRAAPNFDLPSKLEGTKPTK